MFLKHEIGTALYSCALKFFVTDEALCVGAKSGFEFDFFSSATSSSRDAELGKNIVKRDIRPPTSNEVPVTQVEHPAPQDSDDEDDEVELEGRAGLSDFEADEDFLEPSQALVKNNPILMDHLASHVEGEVSALLGNRVSSSNIERYPVLQILQKTLDVMKVSA